MKVQILRICSWSTLWAWRTKKCGCRRDAVSFLNGFGCSLSCCVRAHRGSAYKYTPQNYDITNMRARVSCVQIIIIPLKS
jgi:hypothetical protein